jgi:hypothetical protein
VWVLAHADAICRGTGRWWHGLGTGLRALFHRHMLIVAAFLLQDQCRCASTQVVGLSSVIKGFAFAKPSLALHWTLDACNPSSPTSIANRWKTAMACASVLNPHHETGTVVHEGV